MPPNLPLHPHLLQQPDQVLFAKAEQVEDCLIAAIQLKDEMWVRRVFRKGDGLRLVAEGADVADIMAKEESEVAQVMGPVKAVMRAMQEGASLAVKDPSHLVHLTAEPGELPALSPSFFPAQQSLSF